MNRQTILRRLLLLRNLEFANIFYLPICLYIALRAREVQHWQPYALSMVVICVVLAQGVLYWHLKLQTISKNGAAFPPYFHRLFSFFRWADIVLLATYPVLLIGNKITAPVDFHASIWSDALFLFAILEYINYYYYQLSHDNLNDIRYLLKHRKLRRSPLSVDLQRSLERVRKETAG